MKTPSFWQSRGWVSAALTPAAWLYALGTTIDRRFTQPRRAPIPVIAVGNITAGGAGKTPTTLALIPYLQALGHTPHSAVRGYGGASLHAHQVTARDDWRKVGDEALLLAKAAPTWVGRDRYASVCAAADAGASLVICDDALQHHALARDLTLLVIDGAYGIGNRRLLPAGPLRETIARAATRCDATILIGEDHHSLRDQLPQPILTAALTPTGDTGFLRQGNWLAFAGIGRPEKFFTLLRELGTNLVATVALADHHAYTHRDVLSLQAQAQALGAQLITTTKDAVKIPDSLRASLHVLPITLHLDDPDALKRLLNARLAPAT